MPDDKERYATQLAESTTPLLSPTYSYALGETMQNKLVILLTSGLFIGCAAKPLQPGAEKIFISNEKPNSTCEFVGEVVGGQGNWWTDDITSTKNLIEGSRNDLRNSAYKIGANYVHIQQTAQDTSYLGGGKIGIIGNAYKCL